MPTDTPTLPTRRQDPMMGRGGLPTVRPMFVRYQFTTLLQRRVGGPARAPTDTLILRTAMYLPNAERLFNYTNL